MADPATMMTVGSFGIAGLCVTSAAALKAWNGWLELRRIELSRMSPDGVPSPVSRIEMVDVRERVRKLEAIASGIDY